MTRPRCAATIVVLCLVAPNSVAAGILFSDPSGGWDYTYLGADDSFGDDGQFDALDGTWQHNENDGWDGTGPTDGDGAPGGVVTLADPDGTDYLRIQDAGDPTAYGFDEPSNKKIYIGHNILNTLPDAEPAVLDDGITISFRARLSTEGPLDPLYNEDTPPDSEPWPAQGAGYEIHGGGRGQFGVTQLRSDGFASQVSFSMIRSDESAAFGLDSAGLIMNNHADNSFPGSVNSNDPGQQQLFPIDSNEALTEWREFWITIGESELIDTDTHIVNVYMDGGSEPMSFCVTEGPDREVAYDDSAYVVLGMSSGSRWGAIDIDYFSYKLGLHTPPMAATGDFNADGNIDVEDVNLLLVEVHGGMDDPSFDLTGDALVNETDLNVWVNEIKGTWMGDANLDGEFSTADFVQVFQAGEYEDGIAENSLWHEGDWNGDLEFDSSDFLKAFQVGAFEQGPRPAAQNVPEPASLVILLWGSLLVLCVYRLRNGWTGRAAQLRTSIETRR